MNNKGLLEKVYMCILPLLVLFATAACTAMDAPLSRFNPIDAGILGDVIKKNDVEELKKMLSTHGLGSFQAGLHSAAQQGRIMCMQVFLECGADVNGSKDKGNVPLHYAKTVKTALFLLEHKALIDKKNEKGRTPLYKALFSHHTSYSNRDLQIAQLLIDNDADINSIDAQGNSLLHSAIEKNNFVAAEFLLRNDIDTDKTNKENLTAFDLVIEHFTLGDSPFFSIFEKYGMMFFPAMKMRHLSDEALCNRWTKENMFTHPNHISINRIGRLLVCTKNYDDTFRCKKEGICFNRYGCTVNNISQEHLQELFDPIVFKKILKNIRFLSIEVASAFSQNDASYLEIILDYFPWLTHNDQEWTHWLMKQAIEKKWQQCLHVLLKTKIDACELISYDHRIDKKSIGDSRICVDHSGSISMPFLHGAILYDNDKAIPLLVEYGADCLQKNSVGQMSLEYALALGRAQCVETLNSLLCQLCSDSYNQGDYKKSKQYMNYVTNVNVSFGKQKDLLLHTILDRGNTKKSIKFIPLLLAKGADINRSNGRGYLPLDYVEPIDNATLILFKMLLSERANINLLKSSLLTKTLLMRSDEGTRLCLQYGAIVSEEMLTMEQSSEIAESLEEEFNKQKCCVCLEHPESLSIIACTGKHSEFLCKECFNKIDKCPLCRGILLK